MASNQITYMSKYMLLLILFSTVPADINSDLYRNQLHFGYGINYKYNGQLYHNLDRVWVVHRVVIPKADDLDRLPAFPDNINCNPSIKGKAPGHQANLHRKTFNKKMCMLTRPHIELLARQASYFKTQVTKLIREDLYHALHSLHPVSHFEYKRIQKRALPLTQGMVLDTNPSSTLQNIPFVDLPRNRSRRLALGAIVSAALPAIGKLATLAVEELGSYLQRKRNNALTKALQLMDQDLIHTRNMMHQLEKDFLLYGEYDINSTQSILKILDNLDTRTSSLEGWLEYNSKEWATSLVDTVNGPVLYSHLSQLYIQSLREKYIRLYEALVTELKLLLRSIAILSKGYLPPQLFPPTTLVEISQRAIAMIKSKNPDYVLALPHITDYYDMRLVTFGLDDQERLVVCFPIFIKDFKKEPMTLYQLETVKVPINDENREADSYTEITVTKPYLASNRDYYIQLVLPELVMCKKIRRTHYCEELFLVKHKTKHSCESAIFYNLTRNTVLQNCDFKYFYNISVLPSVLDGGSHILLANMLNDKRLICSYDQGLARPLPTSSYALVSRDILCHCHLQIGLTYILKNIATCNVTDQPTLEYTVNLAFMDYFNEFWGNSSLSHIPVKPTLNEVTLPISMEDYSSDPDYMIYGNNVHKNPQSLKELSQVNFQKQVFLDNKKKLFSDAKAGNGKIKPRLPETPLTPSKSSFLFTALVHIYMFTGSTLGMLWTLPYIWYAIKHRKLSALVGAMAIYKASPAEAKPLNMTVTPATIAAQRLTAFDIPSNSVTKLVCHDPWVSVMLATITIVGLIVYMYQNCKHLTLVKGYRFASICQVHLILGTATRYVPFKIGQFVGSPFLFEYNKGPQVNQITLHKQLIWDHLHLSWNDLKVKYKNKRVPLREHVTVPLKDKLRLRNIFDSPFHVLLMVKQGDTWYNLRLKANPDS